MSEGSSFAVEKTGNIAWLVLNRPERRNTMTLEFFDEIRSAFEEFDADPEVRVVVIRAIGKSFTAGLDLSAAQALLGDGSSAYRDRLYRKIMELQASMTAIEKCRNRSSRRSRPLYRGVVDITCACDIRLASRTGFLPSGDTT
jgi:enoyl-CoA hydratase